MFSRLPLSAALVLLCVGLTATARAGTGLDITVEAASSLRGGWHDGQSLHGSALLHTDWESTSQDRPTYRGYLSALALAGRGPTEKFLGDSLGASNNEGYESARLYSWWGEVTHATWSLRAGVLLADEEFTGTEAGAHLINSSFGWPAFISANTLNTGPAFYVPAPGLRLAYTPSETTTFRAGIYDGDTFDAADGDPTRTRHGLHYQIGGEQGWFIISELAVTPVNRPTRYKLGAWFHTANFADVRDDGAGQPIAHSGADPRRHGFNYGLYTALEHTCCGQAGKAGHLDAYLRTGLAPADRNTLSWTFDTGLAWQGLVPNRPDDITALGFTHAHFSPRFVDAARLADPASPAPDFEQVIELTYHWKCSDHIEIQPDWQWIRHPGGSRAQRDALVFLLRLNASF